MASDDCIPIKVALQLMDNSSLGLADQYDQFQEVHQQLQNALKVIQIYVYSQSPSHDDSDADGQVVPFPDHER